MCHQSSWTVLFLYVLSENGENSKGSNDKNGGTSTPSSSKIRSSKPAKSSKNCKRSRWDFMLPMPATQPAALSSDSSAYRWQKHMKMSKYVFPKKPPTMKPPSDYSPQSLIKGNGKQPYKVLVSNCRNGSFEERNCASKGFVDEHLPSSVLTFTFLWR